MMALPEPGIYFGMDEDDYHRVFALSSSGIKKLGRFEHGILGLWSDDLTMKRSSRSFLTTARRRTNSCSKGETSYLAYYAIELDLADFEGVLASTDEIKAAIKITPNSSRLSL